VKKNLYWNLMTLLLALLFLALAGGRFFFHQWEAGKSDLMLSILLYITYQLESR
jgi:hypothetical protein